MIMMEITLRGRWLRSESIGIIRGIAYESCDIVRGEHELELCMIYIRFGMKQVGVSKIRNVISAKLLADGLGSKSTRGFLLR